MLVGQTHIRRQLWSSWLLLHEGHGNLFGGARDKTRIFFI
jgi:hypothetical protein